MIGDGWREDAERPHLVRGSRLRTSLWGAYLVSVAVAAILGHCHSRFVQPDERPVFGANSRVPPAGWLGLLIGSALALLVGIVLLPLAPGDRGLALALTVYGAVTTAVSAWHFRTTRSTPRPQ